jgi:hypothetical protein
MTIRLPDGLRQRGLGCLLLKSETRPRHLFFAASRRGSNSGNETVTRNSEAQNVSQQLSY